MFKVYAKHLPYEDGHLGKVVEDMRTQGAPTIRVVEYKGYYFALEGSHRIAAAHYLNLTPNFVVLEPDAEGINWDPVVVTLPQYEFPFAEVLCLYQFG